MLCSCSLFVYDMFPVYIYAYVYHTGMTYLKFMLCLYMSYYDSLLSGYLELLTDADSTSIAVKLMPLVGGYLYLPEVRLRNVDSEEFLPGQVYDSSKLSQVFVDNVEE